MVPRRFSIEYSSRWLTLVEAFEERARDMDLLGTFSLMAAASILVIPYERLRSTSHPFDEQEGEQALSAALKSLSKVKFLKAPFWPRDPPRDWRYARIVDSVDTTASWIDENGQWPFETRAKNDIGSKSADQIVRLMRNALAHGNVLYLNQDGRDTDGRVEYLAFLSRYEEDEEQRKAANSYRLLVVPESGFLFFLKSWAAWLQTFGTDPALRT